MSTPLRPASYAADTTAADRAWVAHGICVDSPDPDAWHPTREDTPNLDTRRAIRVCGHCPVAQACRDYATARPWLTGIWGATTTAERARMRRTRRRTAV